MILFNRFIIFNKKSKNNIKRNFQKFAFTLAEVLIVIGIIGIVAELTIPQLMKDFQTQVYKVAFRKAYSVASAAWLSATTEAPGTYTSPGGWFCTWPDGQYRQYDANDGRTDAIKAKMKVVKTCINQTGCWASNFENDGEIVGNTSGSHTVTTFSWVTADGMCWTAPWKNYDESQLMVDTNCNKKPNKIGQDIFSFMLGADGVIYFAIDNTSASAQNVSRGLVCPYTTDPYVLNGRSISFKDMLSN